MSAQEVNITTREVSRLARVAPSTVRRWVESGALHPSQITPGGQFRFNRADVLALLSPSSTVAETEVAS